MVSEARSRGARGRGGVRDTDVRPYTRALAVALIPFLVAAWVLLYVLPGTTEQLFAWTITPALSAMLLASAYVGGIWFFALVIHAREWATVRRGYPAVLTFATLALVATVLHWDRFHFGHVSFVTWVTLYICSPFLVAAALVIQRGSDRGSRGGETASAGHRIARWQRFVLAGVGIVASVTGIVLFINPALLVDAWAWQLTPLTARITGAILTLPGMVNVWLLVDARWIAFRGIFQAQLVSLAFIVVALAVARKDLDWLRSLTPWIVGGFAVSAIAYAAFYLANDRAARRTGGRPAPP